MDSTAMVGQMISLNQLAQLTSINQAVGGSTTSVTGAMQPSASGSTVVAASKVAQPAALGVAANQLPFDPNTMMPLTPAATPSQTGQSTQSLK
jgi:flagellar basal-body rod modification protein FlgD